MIAGAAAAASGQARQAGNVINISPNSVPAHSATRLREYRWSGKRTTGGLPAQDAHLPQRRADEDAVEKLPLREGPRGGIAGGGRRTGGGLGIREVRQCGREPGFSRVAERVPEVIRDRASRDRHPDGRGGVRRGEAVTVAADALGVDTLELDREVGRAAVVLRIEAVGLAAGGRAN